MNARLFFLEFLLFIYFTPFSTVFQLCRWIIGLNVKKLYSSRMVILVIGFINPKACEMESDKDELCFPLPDWKRKSLIFVISFEQNHHTILAV